MTSDPHLFKEIVVKAFAYRYGIDTFIETGTFRGAMVQAAKDVFKQVYSIELDPTLYIEARQKFESFPNVHIVNGNSADILKHLCGVIQEPTLFWLDAHYSGEGTARGEEDTPILDELHAIGRRSQADVILIDDARLFGMYDWPTLEEIQMVARLDKRIMTVEDNIIRLEPKSL